MSTVWDVGEQDDEEEEVDVGWSPQDPWDPLTIDDPDILFWFWCKSNAVETSSHENQHLKL